jgi:biopolymer transport protein ExbB
MIRSSTITLVGLLAASVAGGAAATTSLSERMEKAGLNYSDRLNAATEQLHETRQRVAAERIPLVEGNRRLQQQIIALEMELLLLRTEAAQAEHERRRHENESDELRRTFTYLRTTVDERLQQVQTHLLPGEQAHRAADLAAVREQLKPAPAREEVEAAARGLQWAWTRVETLLGGHATPGQALADGSNAVHAGTFLLLGPESYFRSHDGSLLGIARQRDSGHALVHRLPMWPSATAEALWRGEPATFPADVLGGKALRLDQATGTWLDHVRKGGVIGYVIIALGGVALIIAIWKVFDLRGLAVDPPLLVRPVLSALHQGREADARTAAAALRTTTRELFTTTLDHASRPKSVIEEQLYALILRWRLHHERRLPLLAVIVTASPLLGLLGTVTGMVKTFTLITVFGTGNADKLASGISEALVTTQLGLTIAIPTLIVHGYLSQRVKKRLALLERYAVEGVAATEMNKSVVPVGSV